MTRDRAVPRLPRGRPEPLAERVVVVSPHLDDAVLSLGATLAAHVRGGGQVRVVTALAGRPSSVAPAGEWDRGAGFATEGEAARTRRAEDRAACELLGLEHRHVEAADEQYGRPEDEQLWRSLAQHLAGSGEVLLPGFPLTNADHAAVTDLVLSRCDPATRVRLWLEEPYALRERAPSPGRWGGRVRWGCSGRSRSAVVAKVRAVRRYRSQLPLLAPGRLAPPSRLGGLLTVGQLTTATAGRGEWVTTAGTAGDLTSSSGRG